MRCSVVIPTRFRVEGVKSAIESIFTTARRPKQIEVILRVHDDDKQTQDALPEILETGNVRSISGPNLGFAGDPVYSWELCQAATGRWIFGFNDDLTIDPKSKGWDMRLDQIPPRHIGLPEVNCLGGSTYSHDPSHPFAILPNRWWESFGLTGFLEPTDAYIYGLLRGAGWGTHFIPGLITHHDQHNDVLRQSEGRRVG